MSKQNIREMGLLDSVMALRPGFVRPGHLAGYAEALEATQRTAQRITLSCPPRFSKTETTLAGIVWLLARNPNLRIGYASFDDMRARNAVDGCAELAKWAEVPLVPYYAGIYRYRCRSAEGGIVPFSPGSSPGSIGLDLIIVDSPFRDHAQVHDQRARQRVLNWFTSVATCRLEPGGSLVVIDNRWRHDDLVGTLVAGDVAQRWRHFSVKARRPDGSSSWPEVYSAEALADVEAMLPRGTFAAMYMCEPVSTAA